MTEPGSRPPRTPRHRPQGGSILNRRRGVSFPPAPTLWGRAKLAADSGVPDRPADGYFDGIALAHNLRSREQVDELVDAAERAGATITRPPAETSYGGYAACFADPDGHIWEIAHNPGFTLAEDGTLQLPDFG